LKEAGCRLIVADIITEKTEKARQEFGAEIVSPEKIFEVEADVFSPCALGGVINAETVEKFKVKIIAGPANNQLADEKYGEILHKKGIIYAPDFVIGAGGMINVANELGGYVREKAVKQATGIYDIMKRILKISEESKIPTYKAANILAKARIAEVKKFRQRHA
jgi:leucine dehydrogenase